MGAATNVISVRSELDLPAAAPLLISGHPLDDDGLAASTNRSTKSVPAPSTSQENSMARLIPNSIDTVATGSVPAREAPAPAIVPPSVEGEAEDPPSSTKVAPFSISFDVRWADCDPNRHLRHSAYADYATHVRLQYIEAQGFSLDRFESERFGPVILREETQYLREVRMGEKIRVDFSVLAFSDDHTRWSVMHTIWNAAGKRAAVLLLDGVWLHMETRRGIVPPDDLCAIMMRLPVGKVPSYKRFLR